MNVKNDEQRREEDAGRGSGDITAVSKRFLREKRAKIPVFSSSVGGRAMHKVNLLTPCVARPPDFSRASCSLPRCASPPARNPIVQRLTWRGVPDNSAKREFEETLGEAQWFDTEK